MRHSSSLAVVLVLGVALLSACGSSSRRPLSKAQRVRGSIISTALAQKSVHWTEHDRPHMSCGVDFISDVGVDSGRQRINSGVGCPTYASKAVLLLVDDVVYVRGDPGGLKSAISLTNAQAQAYAGRWISIPKGDKVYASAAAGVTLGSLLHEMIPQGRLRAFWESQRASRAGVGPTGGTGTRTPGHGVQVLQAMWGGGWVNASLAVPSSDGLPAGYWSSGCIGCSDGGRFSSWNEPLDIHAPAHSTPIATVRRD